MPAKILIVDDMPEAIEFLPQWLQREGYETLMATRGQQALVLAEEQRPDIILLDVMMPGMDGIETCRRLRMNPTTAHIPIILLSGRSPSEAHAEGLLAGATDYITKPIHFPDLLERIERTVRHKQHKGLDHHRLLSEMAYTALTVLPCKLAWLLILDSDNRWLLHQAAALEGGPDMMLRFLKLLQGDNEALRFPLRRQDNPLAEVVLNHSVLLNASVHRFPEMPGGEPFFRAFSQFHLDYITLLPLVSGGRTVGVMVLATTDPQIIESQRVRQILNSLSAQAAMVVDNARLLADLAAQEGLMRAEQAFRKMVLDTMGEGLIVVDDKAMINYVNNRLLNLTDYTREMLYGRSVGLLFHPSQREKVVASVTGSNRSTLPFSQELYTRHGRTVPVLLSRVVIPSPSGEGQNTVMVVTDLTELHRQQEALRLQTQRLQALNSASEAISSARTFQEVIMISLESALHVVKGVTAALLLRDEANPDVLVTVASIGFEIGHRSGERVPVGEGLVGWVGGTGKSQLIADAAGSALFQSPYAKVYNSALHSLIAVPLVATDEVIGVLEVINKDEGLFDEADLETLQSLAGFVAIAIENVRLMDQMRRRVTELTTLLDASAAVSSTLDFGDMLERIARRLSLALQVERVVIASWNRQANRLETLAEVVNAYWAPGNGPVRRLERIPLARAAFETGRAALAGPGESALLPADVNPSALRTIAAFPIRINGAVQSVILLHHEAPGKVLSLEQVNAVNNVIADWLDNVQAHDPRNWLTRSNLTDLCQQVLQASGQRWCSLLHRDPTTQEVRLLREIGQGLWLDAHGKTWDVARYPSLARVLSLNNALTLQSSELENDPDERAYLNSIGGTTCLVAPLFVRGESVGLVKLVDSNREGRRFDAAELSLCQGIANVVGNAMENAQLYAMQEQRASALEAAYTELQESDRIKDELLQNLSHELRTPLTHILGYLRLLADGAFGPTTPEQDQAMRLVLSKAQHLAALVKDIVTVQESDAHNLTPKPIHLERVVALAVRSVMGKAQERDIQIIPRIPVSLPPVMADAVRVGEVFEELLENAIKFSPDSTQIEVMIEDTGGPMVHACVRDQGIGIPPEEHDKIFRRFYQVNSGTTRRYGGTGLGLAIVRQVVEGHNGRVWVESAPNQGSCFHLTLPKASALPHHSEDRF